MSQLSNKEIDILIKEKKELLKKITEEIKKDIKKLRDSKKNILRTHHFVTEKELEDDMDKLSDDITEILDDNNIDLYVLGDEFELNSEKIIFDFVTESRDLCTIDNIMDELNEYIEPMLNKIKYMNKIDDFTWEYMAFGSDNTIFSITYEINIKN